MMDTIFADNVLIIRYLENLKIFNYAAKLRIKSKIWGSFGE
jgi:hypothetical protein